MSEHVPFAQAMDVTFYSKHKGSRWWQNKQTISMMLKQAMLLLTMLLSSATVSLWNYEQHFEACVSN